MHFLDLHQHSPLGNIFRVQFFVENAKNNGNLSISVGKKRKKAEIKAVEKFSYHVRTFLLKLQVIYSIRYDVRFMTASLHRAY